MYVTKEKNIITYTISEGKNYIFDINSLIFYGLSGKPLKRLPTEVKDYYNTKNLVVRMARYMFSDVAPVYFNKYTNSISLADKLSSMGYTTDDLTEYEVMNFSKSIGQKIYDVEITEKLILNFIKKRIEENQIPCNNDFIEQLKNEAVSRVIKIELTEKDRNLINHMVSYYNIEEIKLIAHWLVRGLGWFYNYNEYNIKRALTDFFEKAKWLEYKPTKDDVLKQILIVNKNYETKKREIDGKKLVAHQTKYNLNFENDDFIVVVPLTSEEFEREGNMQKNCVFTSYLSSVVNGVTNVVFVRKKSDINTPYITCEVNRRGNINQYLGKCNSWVKEEKALQFEKRISDLPSHSWNLLLKPNEWELDIPTPRARAAVGLHKNMGRSAVYLCILPY